LSRFGKVIVLNPDPTPFLRARQPDFCAFADPTSARSPTRFVLALFLYGVAMSDLLAYGRQALANQAFSFVHGGERKLCATAQGTIRRAE